MLCGSYGVDDTVMHSLENHHEHKRLLSKMKLLVRALVTVVPDNGPHIEPPTMLGLCCVLLEVKAIHVCAIARKNPCVVVLLL